MRTNFVEKCRVFCVLFVVAASIVSIVLVIKVLPAEGQPALAVSELATLIALTFASWARTVAMDLRKEVMNVPDAHRGIIDMEGCCV